MISAPTRRGACPSLSAPMQTGDGLLVRLNPLHRALTPGHLSALAQAAARFGNGLLEITARGSLQIRGLTAASAPDLARFVDGLDLAVRDGVPVETAALAGLDPQEIADPRPLAASIREAIAQLGLSARLGPKVSVVVDGGGRSMLDGVKADVRLTAFRDEEGGLHWQLALAGDAKGAISVADFVAADACAAAMDQLAAIAALGKTARAKDLRSSKPGSLHLVDDKAQAALPYGHPISLTDSRIAIRVALPFGAIDAATLTRFSDTLGTFGVAELRLCPERSLLVLCATEIHAMSALASAHDAGLIVDAADPRLAIVACAGAPACASAHYATKPLAEAIVREVPHLLPAGAKLHLSGCDKRCAEPGGPSIAVIGREDGGAIASRGASISPALRHYLLHSGVIRAEDRQAS